MKKQNSTFNKLLLVFLISFTLILNGCSRDTNDILKVHFIDVGQGDSTLIQYSGKNILIDGGPLDASKNLVNYLRKHNVSTIDMLILTHPHNDHYGGLTKVVRNFTVKSFYTTNLTSNDEDFKELLYEIREDKIKTKTLKSGDMVKLSESAMLNFTAPNSIYYDNVNDYSLAMRLSHNKNSFFLTGDIEEASENEILQTTHEISSDILKVAHHGSSSSSTKEFIQEVSPEVAVISVGKRNLFSHPTEKTLSTLDNSNIKVLRTDELGSILMQSDGEKIYIQKKVS